MDIQYYRETCLYTRNTCINDDTMTSYIHSDYRQEGFGGLEYESLLVFASVWGRIPLFSKEGRTGGILRVTDPSDDKRLERLDGVRMCEFLCRPLFVSSDIFSTSRPLSNPGDGKRLDRRLTFSLRTGPMLERRRFPVEPGTFSAVCISLPLPLPS